MSGPTVPSGNEDAVTLAALQTAVREVEAHAALAGWDSPARLFALVPTDDLVRREPGLAARLRLDQRTGSGGLTPVEQEPLPPDRALDQVLARIEWPDAVAGAAAVVERVVLPPAAEAHLGAEEAERVAAEHPDRDEVRVAAGVLRDGRGHCVVRLRSADSDDARVEGEDVVPGLVRLLSATLRPSGEVGRS